MAPAKTTAPSAATRSAERSVVSAERSSGPRPPIVDLHIPVLDGIRGLAIVLVMLHHFCMKYTVDASIADRLFFSFTDSTWCGVDLFFVLSGFLITGILVDAKGEKHALSKFYMRRTLRIFPLYYAVLFAFYVVLPQLNHPAAQEYIHHSAPHQVWYWTYLTNVHLALRGSLYDHLIPNIFWSLSIEEQFYIIWPVIALSCSRRTLFRIAASLVVIALLSRIVMTTSGTSAVASFALPFARMDCLAVGACLALVSRSAGGLDRRVKLARITFFCTAALILCLAVPFGRLDWGRPIVHTLGFSALAIFFGSLLTLVVATRGSHVLRRALDLRPLRKLGKYSYALYMVHGPVGTACKFVYDPEKMPLIFGSAVPRLIPYILLAGAVSYGVALLSWHLLEKHFLRLKDAFR